MKRLLAVLLLVVAMTTAFAGVASAETTSGFDTEAVGFDTEAL